MGKLQSEIDGKMKAIGEMTRRLQTLTKKRREELGAVKEGASGIGTSMKQVRRLEVAIDSGACDNVMDPDELPEHEVKETRASKDRDEFQSATGEPIPNLGEMNIMMNTK